MITKVDEQIIFFATEQSTTQMMILDAGICFYGIMESMFFATSWIANPNLIEISAYQEENNNKLGKKHFINLVHIWELRL